MCSSITRITGSASGPEAYIPQRHRGRSTAIQFRARTLDVRVLTLARTRLHSGPAERAVSSYSRLGEHGGCWIALGLAGAVVERNPARRARWLRGVRVVVGSYAANQGLKFLIRRKRPQLDGLPALTPTVSRLSFPSAHATTSFAAARAYAGPAPAAPLYLAAMMFGLSRPYLGVHYPSDVLAGAALGTLIAQVWHS